MSTLLALHLLLAGVWLGCVLAEALFERALLASGPANAQLLARLHLRVDVAVEVPAFLGVLLTGTWMLLGHTATDLWLAAKIAAALLAVLANAWCVALVIRRVAAAQRGDRAAFLRLDHRQHQLGAVVLAGMLVALMLGLVR
jgi:uncharacterized membrane protein